MDYWLICISSNTSSSDTKWESFDFFYRDKEAVAEILRDTVRSATRAEISGSWRAPKTKVQSRLLNNALSQALQSNRRLSKKSKWILRQIKYGWKTCHQPIANSKFCKFCFCCCQIRIWIQDGCTCPWLEHCFGTGWSQQQFCQCWIGIRCT